MPSKQRLSRRAYVINELLASEYRFGTSIELVCSIFIDPLRVAAAAFQKADEPLRATLTEPQIDLIFGNMLSLRNLSRTFQKSIELAIAAANCNADGACVGPVFVRFAPFFNAAFSEYCEAYDRASSLAAALLTESCAEAEESGAAVAGAVADAGSPVGWDPKPFRDFVSSVAASKSCGSQSLQSLLIMPVQRVPRYRLLIQELLKNTPEAHADSASLRNALSMISKVASAINASARTKEETMRVYDRFQSFVQLPRGFTPYRIGRRIVREGTLQKVCRRGNRRARFFVLLSDRDERVQSLRRASVRHAARNTPSGGDGGVASAAVAVGSNAAGAGTGVWLAYGQQIVNTQRFVFRSFVDVVDVIDIDAQAASSSAVRRIRALSKRDPQQLGLVEPPVPPRSFILRGKTRSFVLVAPTVKAKMEWLVSIHEAVQSRRRAAEEIGRMVTTNLLGVDDHEATLTEPARGGGEDTATGMGEGKPAQSEEAGDGVESGVSAVRDGVVWQPDTEACTQCASKFWMLLRRHHCRACGSVVCNSCSLSRRALDEREGDEFAAFSDGAARAARRVRVCDECIAKMPRLEEASRAGDDAAVVLHDGASSSSYPSASASSASSLSSSVVDSTSGDDFRRRILRTKLEKGIITANEYELMMHSVDRITSHAAAAVAAATSTEIAPPGGGALAVREGEETARLVEDTRQTVAREAMITATMASLSANAYARVAEIAALRAPRVATSKAAAAADMAAVFAAAAAASFGARASAAANAAASIPLTHGVAPPTPSEFAMEDSHTSGLPQADSPPEVSPVGLGGVYRAFTNMHDALTHCFPTIFISRLLHHSYRECPDLTQSSAPARGCTRCCRRRSRSAVLARTRERRRSTLHPRSRYTANRPARRRCCN